MADCYNQIMSLPSTNEALYGSDRDDNAFENISSSTSELGGVVGADTPSDETPEEREQRMIILREELEKVISEIAMLQQVLGSKVRHANELKRQLGVTPFQQFKHDIQQGLKHIKNSESYQKTSSAVKTATEKTSSAINSMGQAVVKKMGDIKKSQTFKSFHEKVHATYANVKAKVTDSRSSGDIDKAFRDAHDSDDGSHTPNTTDDISEDTLP